MKRAGNSQRDRISGAAHARRPGSRRRPSRPPRICPFVHTLHRGITMPQMIILVACVADAAGRARRSEHGRRAGAEVRAHAPHADPDGTRARHQAGARPGDRAAIDVVVVGADDPRARLRAPTPRAAGRRAPPHSGPDHQSAPGRRQGRAVSHPRLRRRSRHRPGDLRRQPPREPAQPRPRPGLRRPALPHPGDGARRRRPQGAVLRRVRRLRHRRRRQLPHARLRRGEHAGDLRGQLQHPALSRPAVSDRRIRSRPSWPSRATTRTGPSIIRTAISASTSSARPAPRWPRT